MTANTKHTTFTWNDEGTLGYAETDDPRILAIVQLEEYYDRPDGDVYAPAYDWDRDRGRLAGPAGNTYRDDESDNAAERIIEARDRYHAAHMPWETVERYARIFHGAILRQVTSHVSRDYQIIILSTPSWRQTVGIPDASAYDPRTLDGDVNDWQAILDGDVYAVGYAVNPSRVMPGSDVDLSDGSWEVALEYGGVLGRKYAQESAARFDYGEPDLPAMLDIPA